MNRRERHYHRLLYLAGAACIILAGLLSWQQWQHYHDLQQRAIDQERTNRTRLALWRMDAHLIPLLTNEQIPHQQSNPLLPRNKQITKSLDRNDALDQAILSQVPSADRNGQWLEFNRLEPDSETRQKVLEQQLTELNQPVQINQNSQTLSFDNDLSTRNSIAQNALIQQQRSIISNYHEPETTPYKALWHDNELVLSRRGDVSSNQADIIFLDQQPLKSQLLALIADLFPEARLVAADADYQRQRLAALPLRLINDGPLINFSPPAIPYERIFLQSGAMIVTAVLLVYLGHWSVQLASRRQAFCHDCDA